MRALLITKKQEHREVEIDAEAGAVVQVNNYGSTVRAFVYRRFENQMPVFEEVTVVHTHEFDR